MGYQLVITEKPSVAYAIGKVIGANNKNEGYLEGNGYLVSWCVGHLIELSSPNQYHEKLTKWRKEDLPILPGTHYGGWKYEVSQRTEKQFQILKELANRADVESLINACDAGREGELIFRLVYEKSQCRKKFYRLWISSMEDQAIQEGFRSLKSGSEYDHLYEAALCRERADWLVGINATRLFSCLYRQNLHVGRVITPTLAMTVKRMAEVEAFQPEDFYTVEITGDGWTAFGVRMQEKEEAEKIRNMVVEQQCVHVQKITRKEKKESAPKLFDLTTLQRTANQKLGFTAQQTLDYAQELYEMKLITYPRTDSTYLTEDMKYNIPEMADQISEHLQMDKLMDMDSDCLVNNEKVTDHHAIIPTQSFQNSIGGHLKKGAEEVFHLIMLRFLQALAGPYRYWETEAEFQCGGQRFTAKTRECIEQGWKKIKDMDRMHPEKEKVPVQQNLNGLTEGDTLQIQKSAVKAGKTTPPEYYSEATLLSAMEHAADQNADPSYEPEHRGIGTPATRANIIERLVAHGYVERWTKKKLQYLVPTKKWIALITVMPEQIQSPAMTSDWEEKLYLIEKGAFDQAQFMKEIEEMMKELVDQYTAVKGAEYLIPTGELAGKCPHCGAEVLKRSKGWFCSNQSCRFALWKKNAFFERIGKQMDDRIAAQLLQKGKVRLTGCHSARTGKTYAATLLMDTEADGSVKYRLEFDQRKGKS